MRSMGFLFLIILSGPAWGWGGCKHEQQLDQSLDVAGSTLLTVRAAAGDLDIEGVEPGRQVRITGRMCASRDDWLAEMGVLAVGGEEAMVAVEIPEFSGGSFWGSDYAFVDLVLEVPAELPLRVFDSSGDVTIRNTAAVELQDSSGDIEMTGISGNVALEDSSGDVRVEGLRGDLVIVADSSGDVRAMEIAGSVTVRRDSSGDLDFEDVTGDVLVERDSSGDISARDVGGDFTVLRDGSGSVRSSGIEGETRVPD